MSVLCYNKGCGQRFDPENNPEGESCFMVKLAVRLTVYSKLTSDHLEISTASRPDGPMVANFTSGFKTYFITTPTRNFSYLGRNAFYNSRLALSLILARLVSNLMFDFLDKLWSIPC